MLDRLLDRAARRLGMDPAELRRRNLDPPGRDAVSLPASPTATASPIVYDPADYVAAFDRLLERLDYAGLAQRAAGERRGTRAPIGIGLSAYVEGTGLGPFEGADVRVDPGGTVFVHLGVSRAGPGARDHARPDLRRASSASPFDAVVVRRRRHRSSWASAWGRSRAAWPRWPGPPSRAPPRGRAQARGWSRPSCSSARRRTSCSPTAARTSRGVPGRGPAARRRSRAPPCGAARSPRRARPGSARAPSSIPARSPGRSAPTAVVVEVDVETGAVALARATSPCTTAAGPSTRWSSRASSTAASPRASAAALGEELIYDDARPAPDRHASWTIALPRADDCPPLEVVASRLPVGGQPARDQGRRRERGHPAAAAIANAVEDALADYGVEVDRPPVTPSRIFDLLRATGRWPARD